MKTFDNYLKETEMSFGNGAKCQDSNKAIGLMLNDVLSKLEQLQEELKQLKNERT